MRLSKPASTASQLALTVIPLFHQCLSLHLSTAGSFSTHIQHPAIDDADFIHNILNAINQYRFQQDAPNLTWSSELAAMALTWANQCKFTTSTADGQGETGGNHTINHLSSPSHVLVTDVTRVIDDWYLGRKFYYDPQDPTSYVPDHSSYVQQYTQMIWKASKQIGCAWSPPSCNSSNLPNLLYLVCRYDPPGNRIGEIEGNVSCNDCEIPRELRRDVAEPILPTKRTTTLTSIQGPKFDINNKTGDFFASLREDQGLPSDEVNLQQSPGLAQEAMRDARDCQDVVTARSNEIWSETPLSKVSNQTDPWPEVLEAAELLWYSSRFAGSPSEPAPDTDYALIVNPQIKYYSCSWVECHRGHANESIQLFCAFSQQDTGVNKDTSSASIEARDTKPINLAAGAAYAFSAIRKWYQLPTSAQNLTRSWILEDQAQGDAVQCNSLVRDPNTEIYYEVLTSTIQDKDNLWLDMLDRAIMAWASSSSQDSNIAKANGFPTPFDLIVNSTFKSFGCAWSPICHVNTVQESYELYCAFSESVPLKKRDNIAGENPLEDIGPDDLNTAAQMFFTKLRNDTLKTGLAGDRCILEKSAEAESQAAVLAGDCSGEPADGVNGIVFATDGGAITNEPAPYSLMTDEAFAAWDRQKDMVTQSDFLKIINTSIESFGCAWSGKCPIPSNAQVMYYLHCVFAANATGHPSTTIPAHHSVSELRVRDEDAIPTIDPKIASADAAKDAEWDLWTYVQSRLADIRNQAGVPLTQLSLTRSPDLDQQANTNAHWCNGNRPAPYNMAVYKVIVSTDNTPLEDWVEGTKMAIELWFAQRTCDVRKNSDCISDYNRIIDPKNTQFGAAWSNTNTVGMRGSSQQLPCGPLHPNTGVGENYLYVVFGTE